jgi:uncharacterized protein (TIGR02466 family)
MEVMPVFSYPLMRSDAYPTTPAELEVLKSQEWIQPVAGGNRQSANNYLLDVPALKNLRAFLQGQIDRYAYEVLEIRKTSRFYITQSWSNLNEKGAYNDAHFHPNSLISGAFYAEGDECPIGFTRPFTNRLFANIEIEFERSNQFNTENFWIPNQKNHAVLFPSTAHHLVAPNPSGTPRVSLAFNTFVKGPLGSQSGLTELKL